MTTAFPGPQSFGADAESAYRRVRQQHWDSVAPLVTNDRGWNREYKARLREIYQQLVQPGHRVLEIGCGRGDLLFSVRPALGVGVDLSHAIIRQAAQRHPTLQFVQGDAHDLPLRTQFDYVLLSDLVNDLWDVQRALQRLRPLCHDATRIILNTYSRLWEKPLEAVRRLKLAAPVLRQNWLTVEDLNGLLELEDFEVLRHSREILCPLRVPVMTTVANRYLVKTWPMALFAMTNVVVARPSPQRPARGARRTGVVSVVIPARNEAGNIAAAFARVPEMGQGTEMIFVEGHSRDDTYQRIETSIAQNPGRRAMLLRQTGKGKGDAVRRGFEKATGDVLMILDADLTVPPEALPRFLEVLEDGKGEFVNGVRLVYPMEDQAMRFFNLLGNKFFSLAFSWLLGQPVKDTLCGTKVLRKADYERIAANRSYFGDFDPFGDFDLLFGAAKLGLKIVDLPVRYGSRAYGETNIQRWRHGVLLLRMVTVAARRLKFI
jgi:SAM-dependent methyltransferase